MVVYERYGVTHETTNSLINSKENMPLESVKGVATIADKLLIVSTPRKLFPSTGESCLHVEYALTFSG